MKFRVPLIFLLLVVLPTAILSLMAGVAFRNWEAILQRRLEASASAAIDAVAMRLDSALESLLDDLTAACGEAVDRGGQAADFEVLSVRFRSMHPLVREVYVFLNPWGFLWPEGVHGTEESSREQRHRDALTETLRRELAAGNPEWVRFISDDGSCLFRRLPGKASLYVGFEVNSEVFVTQLTESLSRASGEGMLLVADGASVAGGTASAPVIVSDSFMTGTMVGEAPVADSRRLLAQARLKKPFDFIRVRALLLDAAEVRSREALRARLYEWGVVLLAAFILAGALFVLRQAAVEIREARKRSEFVMSVSHDLRTPVASMKMLAESLYFETVKDAGKRKEFLATIISESERLNQLIERVLFLVRFGQNALVYSIRTLNPGELVADAVKLYQARFVGTGQPVRFSLDIAPDLGAVQGDRMALTQLLLNLFDNAQKYSARDQGGMIEDESEGRRSGEIRIDVSVRRVERPVLLSAREWVVLAVRDYGIGMEQRELRRIFRRFYRVKGTGQRQASGVGLGLAMCRHVAEAHGGWIEVSSEPGKGSTFMVFLPTGKGELS